MSQESFVAIPAETPVELRRSLELMVKEIDTLVGNVGEGGLPALQRELITLTDRVQAIEPAPEDESTTPVEGPPQSLELSQEFRDFDAAA